jgi:hypothetical protein
MDETPVHHHKLLKPKGFYTSSCHYKDLEIAKQSFWNPYQIKPTTNGSTFF